MLKTLDYTIRIGVHRPFYISIYLVTVRFLATFPLVLWQLRARVSHAFGNFVPTASFMPL